MSFFHNSEWQTLAEAIHKKKEKILSQILCVNAEMNETRYSKRDLLIAQMEMLDYFLKKPQDIADYKAYERLQETP